MTARESIPLNQPLPGEVPPPVYFAGGFGYDAGRNGRVLEHVAGLGYDVTPVLPDPDVRNADRTFNIVVGGVTARLSAREAIRVAPKPEVEISISNYQQARADELTGMLEKQGYGHVDAIFQSADALNGLLAVHKRPDLFRNVVLAYPAGIVRQPHPAKASLGVFKSGFRGKLNKYKVPPENSFEAFPDSSLRPRPKTAGGFVTARIRRIV